MKRLFYYKCHQSWGILVKIKWINRKTCLKLILLINYPFLHPSFLGGKRKWVTLTSCSTFSDPIDFHHHFSSILSAIYYTYLDNISKSIVNTARWSYSPIMSQSKSMSNLMAKAVVTKSTSFPKQQVNMCLSFRWLSSEQPM